MYQNIYEKYQNSSIATASPETLTLMLYNGAIKFCNQSIDAMETAEVSKIRISHECNMKAQNILIELQATLDHKYAIAKELDQMYDFIRALLIEANIEKSKEKTGIARDFMIQLRDLWKEVIQRTRR